MLKCSCLNKDTDIEIILINGKAFIVCKECGEEIDEVNIKELEEIYWGC